MRGWYSFRQLTSAYFAQGMLPEGWKPEGVPVPIGTSKPGPKDAPK